MTLQDDDKAPLFKNWNSWYFFVVLVLLMLIILFYLFTQNFT